MEVKREILKIQNLSYRKDNNTIFENINIEILVSDTIGVIGPYHIWETFLKILNKEIEDIEGTISINPKYKIEWIRNQNFWAPSEIAIDFLIQYSKQDAWTCYQYGLQFGLNSETLTSPLRILPNQIQNKIQLIAHIAREPDFFILDCPSAFLDLETLLHLEIFLKERKQMKNKGFLVFSSDRQFLFRTCNHILDLTPSQFYYFEGNINQYTQWEKTHRSSFFSKIKSKISQSLGTNTTTSENLYIQKAIYKLYHEKTPDFSFISFPEPQEIIFQCDMSIGIPQKLSLSNVQLQLRNPEKYVVCGSSEEIRTLFLATIGGVTPPAEGDYEWKNHYKTGYFTQEFIEFFYLKTKSIDILRKFSFHQLYDEELIEIAQIFGFDETTLDTSVMELTKAEKSILYLMGLILEGNQILILEEPTKYLDIKTTENLALILREFPGTIIFTCQEQTFTQTVATEVIEITQKDSRLLEQNYATYIQNLKKEIEARIRPTQLRLVENRFRDNNSLKNKRNGYSPLKITDSKDPLANKKALLSYFDKNYRNRKNEIQKLKEELKTMEKILRELEEKRNELWNYIEEYGLHNPEHYKKMDRINKKLEELENKWNQLQARLNELENS